MKDETRKKKSIIQTNLRKWGWKKTLIRGIQIFNLRVKLNWKITLIKEKTNQKNEDQSEINKAKNFWLNNKIENQKYFNKSGKNFF